ncbi:DNA polymerase clamp loader subunit A [bacterium]|nr:DNA polymerase clamp loader subunit A [bacterium]
MSNPFDYLNTINVTKENMMRGSNDDEMAEKDYVPFMINRGLSYFQDTVALANEMNIHHELDKKLQYEFLINIVRKRKRFSKWYKKEDDSDIEVLMEYYGYSHERASQALAILSQDQLKIIKSRLEKGG